MMADTQLILGVNVTRLGGVRHQRSAARGARPWHCTPRFIAPRHGLLLCGNPPPMLRFGSGRFAAGDVEQNAEVVLRGGVAVVGGQPQPLFCFGIAPHLQEHAEVVPGLEMPADAAARRQYSASPTD